MDRLELAVRLGHDLLLYVYPSPLPEPARSRWWPTEEEPAPDGPVEVVRRRNDRNTPVLDPPDELFVLYEVLRREMRQRGLDLPALAPLLRTRGLDRR